MLRILLFLMVLLVMAALIKGVKSRVKRQYPYNDELSASKMLKCKVCDLHITRESALENEGFIYCCEEHRLMSENKK